MLSEDSSPSELAQVCDKAESVTRGSESLGESVKGGKHTEVTVSKSIDDHHIDASGWTLYPYIVIAERRATLDVSPRRILALKAHRNERLYHGIMSQWQGRTYERGLMSADLRVRGSKCASLPVYALAMSPSGG